MRKGRHLPAHAEHPLEDVLAESQRQKLQLPLQLRFDGIEPCSAICPSCASREAPKTENTQARCTHPSPTTRKARLSTTEPEFDGVPDDDAETVRLGADAEPLSELECDEPSSNTSSRTASVLTLSKPRAGSCPLNVGSRCTSSTRRSYGNNAPAEEQAAMAQAGQGQHVSHVLCVVSRLA